MRLNNVANPWTWDMPLSTGVVVVVILGLAPLLGWALAWERWIIFGALTMVALVPIFVRWPVVSTFGLYAFLVPFDTVVIGGGNLSKPVGMLAGVVLAGAGLMERRLGRPPLTALWWGLFTVWAALSAAWAIYPETAFQRLPTVLSLFLLYVIAVSIRPSRKEFYGVCLAAVIGGTIAATLAYLYGLDDGGVSGRGRLLVGEEHFSNPNSLGPALILPFALAIGGFVGLRGAIPRAVAIGLMGLIGLGMYISMSRAAIVAIIFAISVLLYRLRVRWQILVAVVVLLALVATMPDEFFMRMTKLLTGEDATGSGRTEIWEVGLQALERFGTLGAGLGNFTEVHKIYVTPRGPSGYGYGAHNTYLMVWVELGFLGLALMLAVLGSHFRAVHRVRRTGRGGVALSAIEAAFFGMLALMMFGDLIYAKALWLTLILLTWATYCDGRSDHHGRSRVDELTGSVPLGAESAVEGTVGHRGAGDT